MKKAIVTGIYGQDGSYLVEKLIKKGYEVHGIIRKPYSFSAGKIQAYLNSIKIKPILHEISLNNYENIAMLFKKVKFHECYHFAATHYSSSKSIKERENIDRILYENNVLSASNLIHSISQHSPSTNYIQAGSCLMYETSNESLQNEKTPYSSNSNYGQSKIVAAQLAESFRQKGLHMSTAILFNHESPRRSVDFVTQKIAQGVASIKSGQNKMLKLANLDSKKDWGYAPDYVDAMWRMAQLKEPEDFVLATGKLHSIEDFVKEAFSLIGISNWSSYIEIDNRLAFKTGVSLLGDPQKAYSKLDWKHSLNFKQLVKKMVESSISRHFY